MDFQNPIEYKLNTLPLLNISDVKKAINYVFLYIKVNSDFRLSGKRC